MGMNELNKAFIHLSVTPWHVSLFAVSDIFLVPHTDSRPPTPYPLPPCVHFCSTERWPHFQSTSKPAASICVAEIAGFPSLSPSVITDPQF